MKKGNEQFYLETIKDLSAALEKITRYMEDAAKQAEDEGRDHFNFPIELETYKAAIAALKG